MVPENTVDTADIRGTAYVVKGGNLFRAGEKDIFVSNFYLTIAAQSVMKDGPAIKERIFELIIHTKTARIPFTISERAFLSAKLTTKVLQAAGSGAILYGSAKDLAIAAQELSPGPIRERLVYTSAGFQEDGSFLSKGIRITAESIGEPADMDVDLSEGNYARNLSLRLADRTKAAAIGKHLIEAFLSLKKPDVMYPLAGHIALAPFASQIIPITGKSKPAVHLHGPSGGGKTFLANLAMAFSGVCNDRSNTWQTTVNAIEAEGFYSRDHLFLVDDYKASCTDPQAVVNLIQKYAEERGRGRLKPSADLQKERFIRGLLLSTGEDFVSGVESLQARTIVITIERDKNEVAGRLCMENRHDYAIFLPYLIQRVISRPRWREELSTFVTEGIEELRMETAGFPNGLRISANWALNWWGFQQFVNTLIDLGATDEEAGKAMKSKYRAIVSEHLKQQASAIANDSPASIMFEVLGERLSAGAIRVEGLDRQPSGTRGKLVGKLRKELDTVHIFPNTALEIIASHFRTVGQRMPFTERGMRDSLVEEGLIEKSDAQRYTTQIRLQGGGRRQAWSFSRKTFEDRCGPDWGEDRDEGQADRTAVCAPDVVSSGE